jgi:pyridoxine 5-phosphate synthase
MVRLGLNIDHVATLREARRSHEPDPIHAAFLATTAGADGITVHLRSDRRHIQDRDLRLLREVVRTHLNLEMAPTPEMARIAARVRPDAICLVPERPDEVTTQGGLDLGQTANRVRRVRANLSKTGILLTAFIEPGEEAVRRAVDLGFQAVELNTDSYATARGAAAVTRNLDRFSRVAEEAHSLGLEVHAGHGLNYWNVARIVAIPQIVEVNIGHAVVARAVLVGLERAVREMADLVHREP